MSGDDLPQLDTRHAHPARVYDYWLGGKDNFAADREAAEQVIAADPGIATDVRANRAFLARACGTWPARPASGSSSTSAPASRPPATRTRWRRRSPRTPGRLRRQRPDRAAARPGPAEQHPGGRVPTTCDADLRDPGTILRAAARTLDFGRPVALMLLGDPAPDPGRRGPVRDRGPADGRAAVRQLPGDLRTRPSDIRAAQMARSIKAGQRADAWPGRDHARPGRDRELLRRARPGRAGRGPAPAVAARAGNAEPAQVTAWCGVARKR